jgi:two-component system sensor histidine kinase/response regulator
MDTGTGSPSSPEISRRIAQIREANLLTLHASTDRTFLWLLLAQWAFALVLAVWLSPYAWEGKTYTINLHVKIALFGGALINTLPIALILRRPGWVGTRCVVAMVQMLWSAILIHLTGGRIETHFHVFGSLAFLAFYRDWRVIVVATVTVATDHFLRGLAWPESVYGTLNPQWWRFLEHAGWVLFEDIVLLMGCARATGVHGELAEREARLEVAHESVERQVVERTRELEAEVEARKQQAEELGRARVAAEAASRAKSAFLANMSHEIRTPMNGVLGFTNLLLDTPLNEEQRDHVRTIRQSGESLLSVINDILDFSKVEAGKLTLERVPFSLAEAIAEVAELLAPQAEAKGLEIAFRANSRLPAQVEADPGRVRQVLLNLTGNALKFTRAGHVTIETELVTEPASGAQFIRCTVSDTGIGIPGEKQALVFQEFMQADTSTTREFGGTGLGLAISKRLVTLMGGSIGFRSEAGAGSHFWFELPVAVHTALEQRIDEPAGLRDLNVLVVDDLAVNRRLLAEQLQAWGIRHVCVESGEQALLVMRAAVAESRPFDIALADYLMPGMDGLELVGLVRADPGLAATALVVLTSGSHRSAAQSFIDAGYDVFLTKPVVRPAQLLNAIGRALQARGRPVQRIAQPVAQAPEAPSITRFADRAPLVLVAEDNAVNQKLVKRLLERLGCCVDIAGDGAEAVAMAGNRAYDVIFMDCSMPVMDGFRATAQLRSRANDGRRVPIIAFTANALAEDRQICLAAGMDDYLSKPVRIDLLKAVLVRWTQPAADAQPAAAGL